MLQFISKYFKSKDYSNLVIFTKKIESVVPEELQDTFINLNELFICSISKSFKLPKDYQSIEQYVYLALIYGSYHKILYRDSIVFPIKVDKKMVKLHELLLNLALEKGHYTQEEYENEIKARDELLKA